MKPEYVAWIQAHYPTRIKALAMCATATGEMVKAFPELIRTRGWVRVDHEVTRPSKGAEHWWCKTTEGEIVDPTRVQFESPTLFYLEFDSSIDMEPIGKCMNCGGYCWPKNSAGEPIPGVTKEACCQECKEELEAYYHCSFG